MNLRIGAFLLTVVSVTVSLFAAHGATQEKADPLNGVTLYRNYCASCHGVDGKGVGPMAEWLRITTPDLTRIAKREGGKFPSARVQRIISGEENIVAGHGTREMPVWGPVFSRVENDQDFGRVRIYNLSKYLESMQAK